MRKCFGLVIVVATAGMLADAAWAEEVSLGKQSFTKVYDACQAVGGTFTQYPSNSYGCEKKELRRQGRRMQRVLHQ